MLEKPIKYRYLMTSGQSIVSIIDEGQDLKQVIWFGNLELMGDICLTNFNGIIEPKFDNNGVEVKMIFILV